MSIQKEEVEKVAHLARIQIDEKEVPAITESINQILSLVDKMQQVDTQGVKPLANPHDAFQRLRDDEVTATNERDLLLANAPDAQDGLFLVPKVID